MLLELHACRYVYRFADGSAVTKSASSRKGCEVLAAARPLENLVILSTSGAERERCQSRLSASDSLGMRLIKWLPQQSAAAGASVSLTMLNEKSKTVARLQPPSGSVAAAAAIEAAALLSHCVCPAAAARIAARVGLGRGVVKAQS